MHQGIYLINNDDLARKLNKIMNNPSGASRSLISNNKLDLLFSDMTVATPLQPEFSETSVI